MLNQQILEGRWQEIKGRIRERWGQITEDELDQARGNFEQLVGTIQRQTGVARREIENFLEDMTGEGSPMEYARQMGQHAVEQAAERLREGARGASDAAMYGYSQAQHMVQERPMQSLAACFGIGVVAGVVVGVLLRSK